MRILFVSFLVTAVGCGLVWQVARREAGRLRDEAAGTTRPETRRDVAPVTSAERISYLEGSRAEVKPRTRLHARQWAALEALDPPALAGWVRSMKHDARDELWQAVVLRWAAVDGPAAMEFAIELRVAHPSTGDCSCCGGEPGGQYNTLPDEVFSCWLREDPAAALAHGPPPDASQEWEKPTFAYLETLVQTDLPRALDLLAANPRVPIAALDSAVFSRTSTGSGSVPAVLGMQLADPGRRSQFVAWLANCNDESVALSVFSMIYSSAPHEGRWLHPDALPEFMPGRDRLPLSLDEPGTAILMGALAVGGNPLEYLSNPTRVSGLCIKAWACRDPESAAMWLERQAGAEDFDKSVLAYTRGIWRDDPEGTIRWCERISHPGMRVAALRQPFQAWQLADPSAAEAWLRQSGLPESHRLYLVGAGRFRAGW